MQSPSCVRPPPNVGERGKENCVAAPVFLRPTDNYDGDNARGSHLGKRGGGGGTYLSTNTHTTRCSCLQVERHASNSYQEHQEHNKCQRNVPDHMTKEGRSRDTTELGTSNELGTEENNNKRKCPSGSGHSTESMLAGSLGCGYPLVDPRADAHHVGQQRLRRGDYGTGIPERPIDHHHHCIIYRGVVSLLHLRGGGGGQAAPALPCDHDQHHQGLGDRQDTGAGILRWLLEEEEAEDHQGDGPILVARSGDADVNDDNLGAIQCGVCERTLSGSEWGWCHCRMRQCGTCIVKPCPNCPVEQTAEAAAEAAALDTPSQKTHDQHIGHDQRPQDVTTPALTTPQRQSLPSGHVRRLVNLWDHIGVCAQSVGDEPPQEEWLERRLAPPRARIRPSHAWVIKGSRNGADIRVCPSCAQDRPADPMLWTTCRCGAQRCSICVGACGQCHAPNNRVVMVEEDRCATTLADNDWVRGIWRAPQALASPTNYDINATDDRTTAEARQIEAPVTTPSWAASNPLGGCYACGLASHGAGHGTCWRICRCGYMYCSSCSSHACLVCPADPVWDENQDDVDTEVEGRGPAIQYHHIASDASSDDGCSVDYGNSAAAHADRPSPDTLLATRDRRAEAHRQSRRDSRVQQRAIAKEQVAQGRRPRRERRGGGECILTTANVTSANSLMAELRHGTALGDSHYLLIQEHCVRGEARTRAADTAIRDGWDVVADDAYIKYSKEGGGTALLTRESTGIRPAARGHNWPEGRISVGTIILGGSEVVLLTIYAISGANLAKQMDLIKVVAETVRTLARPFIVGGDWQISPEELATSGIERALDCTICPPKLGTNLLSRRKLDYFVASNVLLKGGWSTKVHFGCGLATHAPSSLILNIERNQDPSRRLSQPRPLPIHRPQGPRGVKTGVDWDNWSAIVAAETRLPHSIDDTTLALKTWYAGAEQELIEAFDLDGGDDGDPFRGIGGEAQEVMEAGGHRFRHVADRWGLVGQRLNWVSRNLHTVHVHGRRLHANGATSPDAYDIITRIAWRAGGLHRQWREEFRKSTANLNFEDDNEHHQRTILFEVRDKVEKGLKVLYSLVRGVHRQRPQVHYLLNGDGATYLNRVRDMMTHIEAVLSRFASVRSNANIRSIRRWAKSASLKAAHASTRIVADQTRKSASAEKSHIGERTDQMGADRGCTEWASTWGATKDDKSEEIMAAIDALLAVGRREHDAEEILLPPWDAERIHRAASQFKAGTGIGSDRLRPRHVIMLSLPAKKGLSRVLTLIESLRRWPPLLREVTEVAIGKKAGGSRLIGLAAALYRIWARARYADCRIVLETRIERPFLAAAPGKGAVRAAYNEAWANEAAAARGDETATTIVDLKAFYEHITLAEITDGALQFGVPTSVLMLASHLYSGPRRIRVGRSYSAQVHPRRSILAGCTWATLFVRLIVIKPIEALLRRIRERFTGWPALMNLIVYIDDGAISTRGSLDAVAMLHSWVSRLFMQWIRQVLRKEVAPGKVACIASSRALQRRLRLTGVDLGCRVSRHGELLGIDFTAGGHTLRLAQARRRKKAARRRRRLKWLRSHGGAATAVARGGLVPEACFGGSVLGIGPSTMRDVRRHVAATSRVRCSGSSTTAKLALGGPEKFDDVDPFITAGNEAMFQIAAKIWDEPNCRAELVKMWLHSRDDLQHLPEAARWRELRGPVGAAMTQLWRIGATWPKPFFIQVMGHEVSLLEHPPRLIGQLLRAQSRLRLDMILLERLCLDKGWCEQDVREMYKFGIDWEAIRRLLRSDQLLPAERHALLIVTTGGFWSDIRRWHAGMVPTGTCCACFQFQGSDRHHLHECDGLHWELLQHQLHGRVQYQLSADVDLPGLAPLLEMGLPPLTEQWQPLEIEIREGDAERGLDGEFFGDGSGYNQNDKVRRIATWSLITQGNTDSGATELQHMMRGSVPGWASTVPRGELRAYMEFLRVAGPSASFVGDCKVVVDAAINGVPRAWTSAKNINADLWRETLRLQRDREALPAAFKITAHRSRTAAEGEGETATRRWAGNQHADACAKHLAQRLSAVPYHNCNEVVSKEAVIEILTRIAITAAWNLKTRSAAIQKLPRKRVPTRTPDAVSPHDIRPRLAGGWDCRRCRGWACGKAGLRALRARPCLDVVSDQIHPTHVINVDHGVSWCSSCGCYTSRWPRELRFECKGRPAGEAQQNVLRRLINGLPPTTANYFERVRQEDASDARPPGGLPAVPRRYHSRQKPALHESQGRYLRLPGGPLYRPRPPPGAEDQAAGDHHTQRADDHRFRDVLGDYDGGGAEHTAASPSPLPTTGHGERTLAGGRRAASVDLPSRLDVEGGVNGFGQADDVRAADEPPRMSRRALSPTTSCTMRPASSGSQVGDTTRPASARARCQGTSTSPTPRRRIHGKQPPTAAVPIPRPTDAVQTTWCRPLIDSSWSNRIAHVGLRAACSHCGTATKLRCRGCQSAVCISCAKQRVHCETRLPLTRS